jgi:signal transduction histidine kinase
VPPAKTATDVFVVVSRAVAMLMPEAANRGVALEAAETKSVTVPCDADQIRQVVLNLVLNALQATPRGGTVSVSVRQRDGGAEIAVRDDGRGIPDELRDRLFEPFTSQRDGGIGLGLAIVRRIVRAHGGDVRARNRDGRGAEFVVWLPGADAAAREITGVDDAPRGPAPGTIA